jgi:hypothetical protein
VTVALWSYPTDVHDDTPRACVSRLRELGVDALSCAAAYHSARVLTPRGRTGTVRLLEGPGLHVPLSGWPQDAGPMPRSRFAETDGEGFWTDLRRACRDAGLALQAWTVLCHGSSVGAARPDAIVRNCFDDPYPWTLCPAAPGTQAYAAALVGGLAATGLFEAVQLESVGYLGYRHGHHHEMELVRNGPLEDVLLSLCFCRHCRTAARGDGIDADALRQRVGAELRRRWQHDEVSTDVEEIAAAVDADEELAGLLAVRQRAVTALVELAVDRCRSHGVELHTMAAVFAPTLRESAWVEGADLASWASHVDRFVVLGYRTGGPVDRRWIDAELARALAHWPAQRVVLGLNLGPGHIPDRATAVEHAGRAAAAGIRSLSVYHYGMLGDARLGWVSTLRERLRNAR